MFHVKQADNVSGTPWSHAEDQLDHYARWLTTAGIERGLIGPREADRIWPRHILNCAVVALDPQVQPAAGSSVIDIGSGAGLPGIVWSLVRPDLQVTLVESMQRRAAFLMETVELLELGERVRVVRGRAEDLAGELVATTVTARAVAPLERLGSWALPLVAAGGQFLALKGRTAAAELESARATLRSNGAASTKLVSLGGDWLDEPVRVVVVRKGF